jgi:hypothetical protein
MKLGVWIAQSVWRRDTGWKVRLRFPVGTSDFSLLCCVQAGSEAHPAFLPMDTGAHSPEAKRPGRVADHSPPSSAEIKNGGAMPPFPHMSSWRGA